MTENQTVRQLIVSFDIVDEVFHPILFPDIIYESSCSPYSQLVVWDESVALYASIHDGSMGLWLMDDGGGWTKLFAFTALEDVPTPLRYWRGSSHDELLLMVSQEGCLFTFDLDTETQELCSGSQHGRLPRLCLPRVCCGLGRRPGCFASCVCVCGYHSSLKQKQPVLENCRDKFSVMI
ncbi:F-box/kelch-repeat protein [Prunus yedoensis var. nudiflora]|uniref:F-box/kelch-repeat protein n=1 Tax=Prunus yedoensis var. nudiflora TaxID=2094558 RepID=A0A314ZQW5_PRUYE|nr:F-box/kelch-repeat protein [Prunus yedoensis var. nudiflora]